MSNIVDSANTAAQFETERAVRQHRIDHALPAQQIVDGVIECMDCDEAISAKRLAALPHCVRCIDCQCAHETRMK